jgi:hypothetical protein
MQRGTVSERPWGLTLASLAAARARGQLTLTSDDGRLYCIAFIAGSVVGASSPFASDSAVRVALRSQLVSSAQVPALARAVSAAQGRDEIEVIAEAAPLTGEQAGRFRRKLLQQRVARTFSVERGGYVFSESITGASTRGVGIDISPAIFLGARMHLSQDRLIADLRRLGARFVLRGEEVDEARFGFTEHERPILHALRIGTSLPDLEAKRRDLEPRLTQAVIYTLVAAGLCEGLPAARTREGTAPMPMPVSVVSPPPVAAEDEDGVDDLAETVLTRARTTTYRGPRQPAERIEPPRTKTISSMPPPGLRPGDPLATREVIAAGMAQVDAGADHFALLGVAPDATIDAIRTAYVSLAYHLHPERQSELDPATAEDAQHLLAQINVAYGVVSDPVRRADYLAQLRVELDRAPRPGTPTPDQLEPVQAGTAAERARAAAEIAQRGMQALRRDDLPGALELLTRATELAPRDVDYAAQLAWARFCASPDKAGLATEVRRALERAIFRSSRPLAARFYLGRVERLLGRVEEALHHFHEVLELEPNHAEAAAEIRLLEPRTARR